MARPKILILDDDFNLGDRVGYVMPWCAIEWYTNPTLARQSEAYARSTLVIIDGDTVRRSGVTPTQVLNALQADNKTALIVSTRANDQIGNITFLQKPLTMTTVREAVRTLTGYQDERRHDPEPI